MKTVQCNMIKFATDLAGNPRGISKNGPRSSCWPWDKGPGGRGITSRWRNSIVSRSGGCCIRPGTILLGMELLKRTSTRPWREGSVALFLVEQGKGRCVCHLGLLMVDEHFMIKKLLLEIFKGEYFISE
jgi:hypothetical protein